MSEQPAGLILVVDDDPANIEILAEILDGDYEIAFATGGLRAIAIANGPRQPDIVLLDVAMPNMDGYEVCARLKQERATADIPVIFITGCSDVEAETRGLQVGAVDYITKPITPVLVKMRVRTHIELKRARDQLHRLAVTDGLTGLANRRYFDEILQTEHQRLCRTQAPLSMILLDIDHFKAFNDTYGHVAGDDCLRKVGGVINQTINRAGDLAARYGGEEFTCILPDTDVDGATAVAEQIRRAIADLAIPHAASSTAAVVTASVGVATTRCQTGRSPIAVVAQADDRLYAAKQNGRNCVRASGYDAG